MKYFIDENIFENIVCETAAILHFPPGAIHLDAIRDCFNPIITFFLDNILSA